MTKRAWYLGHSPNDVGECAILVGDPDRVDRIAKLLADPVFLPVKRGLKTVTGPLWGHPREHRGLWHGCPDCNHCHA